MAQRPFMIFPAPAVAQKARRGGGGATLHRPNAQEQKQRLDRKFQSIASGIRAVQTTTQGVEPEQVIVFESLGEAVDGLVKAAAKIPGLEWLAEMDLDDVQPQDDFFSEADESEMLPCRLYAVMSNLRAMDQIIALWNNWATSPEQRAQNGFGPFKTLFQHLLDVRRWGPQDRIRETAIVEEWEASLRDRGDQPSRFEAELWYRGTAGQRGQAFDELNQFVTAEGGRCIAQAAIDGIQYHGVLVEMPSNALSHTMDRIRDGQYTSLLRCEGVMFFRPLGQSGFVASSSQQTPSIQDRVADQPPPVGAPQVAILDGLPLEQHAALANRLLIDDPDDIASRYQAKQQRHGTAMASLVLHGDLGTREPVLPQSVYVRPILTPSEDFNGNIYENIPDDSLIVDLIHRAVRRFAFELEETRDSVRIVNLSIGDSQRPFIRELSPLARLLDWLAWEYKLLFLVSAGNQMQPIQLDVDGNDFARLSDDEALNRTLHALKNDQQDRRHWSPAEAVNVVTVGAVHFDHSARLPQDRRIDLLRNRRLPSPFGTVGAGFKRAVKPEILLPGGRIVYQSPLLIQNGVASFEPSIPSEHPPGQLAACPGLAPMELGRGAYSCGTSNATALATRTAAFTLARVHELVRDYEGLNLAGDQVAALLKTVLVHAASWNSAGADLDRIFASELSTATWQERNRLKSRFLGFGEVEPERCFFCNDQRATVLGWGYLEKDGGHEYRLPLPDSLSAQGVKRRLALTLGWLTPINCRHRDYRKAHLWYSFNKKVLGVENEDLDQPSADRGTVVHQVFEGERARAFPEGFMKLLISCREQAAGLSERIPYAFAATLEVAEQTNLPIYQEIQERVRPRVPIRPGGE
jgi:hypothetical protein